MKRSHLIGALIVSLATATSAMAGPYDRDGSDRVRGDEHGREQIETRHSYRPDPHARVVVRAPERYGTYYRPHGYYAHRWVRGERLPVAFYGRPYVVADYRGVGLYGPPRGYHWVRVDGDAVLAAVATGIVLDTVLHVFH